MKIYRFGWKAGQDGMTLADKSWADVFELFDGTKRLEQDGMTLADKSWADVFELFDGTKRLPRWKPLRVEVVKRRKEATDFPFLGPHVLVMSDRARRLLEPLMGEEAESLPLAGASAPYFLVNVLNVIDCLDEERSTVERDPDDGTINVVNHYAFKPGSVDDQTIFKVKDFEVADVFVSETFKKSVEGAKLTGALFKLEAEV